MSGTRGALHLRRALPADAPVVAECVEAAYAHWVGRIGRKPWPMLQDYGRVIEAEHVVVALVQGEIAGVLVLSETPDGFLVDNVAVFPERKGQGIGRALLIHAEQEARERGHASLYLYTNEKMTENIALYCRAGYAEYERRQEQGFCRVFLRKVLDRGAPGVNTADL
jgi:GNAT superfamily N-acetyltransferase